MKNPDPPRDVNRILRETNLPDKAVGRGVREALLLHKRLDAPIAVWEDEAVKWIPAEEIEVPPEEPLDE